MAAISAVFTDWLALVFIQSLYFIHIVLVDATHTKIDTSIVEFPEQFIKWLFYNII